jgi:hypothetical protein
MTVLPREIALPTPGGKSSEGRLAFYPGYLTFPVALPSIRTRWLGTSGLKLLEDRPLKGIIRTKAPGRDWD